MKKFLIGLGVTSIAAASSLMVYLYLHDDEVKSKIDIAVNSISAACNEIKKRAELTLRPQEVNGASATMQNQAWVDEQWESLGI